jgi:hypothetical protein
MLGTPASDKIIERPDASDINSTCIAMLDGGTSSYGITCFQRSQTLLANFVFYAPVIRLVAGAAKNAAWRTL